VICNILETVMTRRKYRRFTPDQCSRGGKWSPQRDWDLHEIVQAFHDARKGHIVSEGATYTSGGCKTWRIQHSLKHANQFDVIHDEKLVKRAGVRKLPAKWVRKRALHAKKTNTTYESCNI